MVLRSTQCMMNMSMRVKGKYLLREKAKEEIKVESLIGVHLAMNSEARLVAHKDTHIICPKYHPRRQPGRCAICGSTRHYTSQCTRPVKPKAKNAEWDNTAWQQEEVEWQESTWETEDYAAYKDKKGKGKGSKSKGKSKGKGTPRSITPRPSQTLSPNPLEVTDLKPKPNLKPALA